MGSIPGDTVSNIGSIGILCIFTLHDLHLALHTPHSTLCTAHFTLHTPHFTLDTPHSTLYTSRITLDTLHFTLHTLHLTPHTPHPTLYSLHFTLVYTAHLTLYTVRSTLYTLQSTLHTLHFHAIHLTLHFAPLQLYTFRTLRCMKPWPSFIFMLRTHTYLSSATLVLHCVTSSRASKGPLRCRRWTFESSPINSHHVGYSEFPHPPRATVHNNPMLSSSSHPTYIASIRRFGCSPYQHAPLVHVDEKAAQLRCAFLCFHAKLPAKLAFNPYPWASSWSACQILAVST